MPTEQKALSITGLRELFNSSALAILTEYRGMTVSEITKLRRDLRQKGTEYHVAKNTLLLRAATELGWTGLDEALAGPTAVAFVKEDIAGGSKAVLDFLKNSKVLVVKDAILAGKLVGPARLEAITKLESKPVLISKMLGSLNAPATNVAMALNAVPRGLVNVLDAYRKKLEEGAAS